MNQENIIPPPLIPIKKPIVDKVADENIAESQPEIESVNAGPKRVTKISELQRMGIEALHNYARSIGIKNLGSLTKSQLIFEMVKTISTMPNEVLYGEG
ncbi:MAG: Rho termination factor N-terminal domain-containing protein, partial [Chlamydiota bacterium]